MDRHPRTTSSKNRIRQLQLRCSSKISRPTVAVLDMGKHEKDASLTEVNGMEAEVDETA